MAMPATPPGEYSDLHATSLDPSVTSLASLERLRTIKPEDITARYALSFRDHIAVTFVVEGIRYTADLAHGSHAILGANVRAEGRSIATWAHGRTVHYWVPPLEALARQVLPTISVEDPIHPSSRSQ